ncbi:sulfite exporter TauE/SafE family protein [Crocosphaera sp. UHCC 0190]|uniref:sulfite exporter TauE/SafE family protein n=1 Tax=Crocosphaera sp. UHCC 0190 TaxID=3110246 RepID=UPI002B213C0D|nr:sulfite exporter TauE/SafE family protein [Crocosphaera sp. UHCC 0190]MEA5512232.1 sulfite exporter TauE/SafE family protein [Crocosphaera sp. UHCC 0190]
MDHLLISLIIFLGVFIQTLSGFGLGLVVMPLLTQVIDVSLAAPLLALIALVTLLTLSIFYGKNFEFTSMSRLIITSSVAIPFGIFCLKNLNETITLTFLGIIVLSYGFYSLFEFPFPLISSPKWGYGFAFFSGLLSGAYNTGGPPIVIYATCCRWPPEQFKSNLNVFLLSNVIVVLINHLIQHNVKPEVWQLFITNIPTILIGLLAGFLTSKFIDFLLFRKLVLLLLIIMGSQLIIKVLLF